MLLFIAWDGDHIGREVGRAAESDDVDRLRRISQAIDQGNLILKSWVEMCGGSMVSMGGDEGRAEVPADRLPELEAVRVRYSERLSDEADSRHVTISVGVGIKLSQAEKALIVAKLRGGDKVVFYTDDMDEEIHRSQQKDEAEKLGQAYGLGKAEQPGYHKPAPAAQPAAPTETTHGEHSSAKDVLDVISGAPQIKPELTHAADDAPDLQLEDQLHDEASAQDSEDQRLHQQAHSNIEQTKAKVVQVLQQVKALGPVMQQVQQAAPPVYQAFAAMASVVVELAREVQGVQAGQLKKSEGARRLVDEVRRVLTPDLLHGDQQDAPQKASGKSCVAGHCYVASEALHHMLGGRESGWVPHVVQHEGGAHWYLKDRRTGRVLDATSDQFATPVPYHLGRAIGFLTAEPSRRAREVLERVLTERQPAGLRKDEGAQRYSPGVDLVHYSAKPGLKRVDPKYMGTSGVPAQEFKQGLPGVPRSYYYRAGTQPEPIVAQGARAVYRARLGDEQRLYDLGEDPQGLAGPSRERFLAGEGGESPEDSLLGEVKRLGFHGYHNSRGPLPNVVALFHPQAVEPVGKEELSMEKGLPMPEVAAHHRQVLPVGAQKDDHLKVQHSDGATSWIQARAGAIRSQDPTGHPISARTPGGR